MAKVAIERMGCHVPCLWGKHRDLLSVADVSQVTDGTHVLKA